MFTCQFFDPRYPVKFFRTEAMSPKSARRKRPSFKRTVHAHSPTAAEEIVALDALVNASGMHSEHFDVHYHEGKWSAFAKHDGLHLAEVFTNIEEDKSNQFTIHCDPHALNHLDGRLDDVEPDPELMTRKPLDGLKVYVLMESQFVPQEIDLYEHRFAQYGATVELVSHLWGTKSLCFHSHYDQGLIPKIRHAVVHIDISEVDINSPETAAVIAPIDVHQRLLYDPNIVASKDPVKAARAAPAVDLMKRALEQPKVVVGAFGHGVELLSPLTDLIKDAAITASPGSLCALCNAGAQWSPPENPDEWATHVVKQISTKHHKNLNLITGTSVLSGGVQAFVDEMTRFIIEIR